jgi:hypothetical protein
VYQVGQLLGMLVKGDAQRRVRTSEVRTLACSDHLKEIIYRCIGERRKRYESATELIAALTAPPPSLKTGVLRSLNGVHLAFTGILSTRRSEAIAAATRRARHAIGEDEGCRPWSPELAAGGRPRRGAEADGDQAAARERAPHYAAQRSTVLAACGTASGNEAQDVARRRAGLQARLALREFQRWPTLPAPPPPARRTPWCSARIRSASTPSP